MTTDSIDPIPRYLTVAGESLRDPNLSVRITAPERDQGVSATCTGCGTEHTSDLYTGISDDPTENIRNNIFKAREWAQGHAEQCRAIPTA
jgi:hypothetical protein